MRKLLGARQPLGGKEENTMLGVPTKNSMRERTGIGSKEEIIPRKKVNAKAKMDQAFVPSVQRNSGGRNQTGYPQRYKE